MEACDIFNHDDSDKDLKETEMALIFFEKYIEIIFLDRSFEGN
jgi:hypothetical protein